MKRARRADRTAAFEKSLKATPVCQYRLRLYVTGVTPRSREAIENIKQLCEKHLKGRYELSVVDIYQQPRLAKQEQIIAAPTLVKLLPAPLRRFIGDMTRTERLLIGLGLEVEGKP